MPLTFGAVHEGFALLRHDLGLFLPHGLAQHVGFAQREAGERLRDAHHLFLVGDDAIGVGEDRLELLDLVGHLDAGRACAR